MKWYMAVVFVIGLFACAALASAADAETAKFKSHPPVRPLPRASDRPATSGPSTFVDPVRGDDSNDGTQERPWQTLAHAVRQLQPGDTLYLRGGTYYEHVSARLLGTPTHPITLRAFPGELAVLDGGIREFFETPSSAWEICPTGVKGEFWSSKVYPNLAAGDGPGVLGNFGDSLIPLQGYRFHGDLQSDNPYWNVENKVGAESFVYCGPGVWYDSTTGRIHARLAPTVLSGVGEDNYRGVDDPRQVPLVIAGEAAGPVLTLDNCRHVRLQDLVLRGARTATLEIENGRNIELEGITVYGGSAAISVRDSAGLRMRHAACRGIGAPWTFRGSLKYRSLEARIFSGSHWEPSGAEHGDFDIAFCEFTDSVDGVFIGNARGVQFHHNLLENITDDGMFLTAGTGYDGHTHGGVHWIYQNRFARILTTFAFGVGHGRQRVNPAGKQTGSGAYIFRNVFDLRRPVWYHWPTGADAPQEITTRGRFGGDHGSPAWEPMWIYHNTIIAGGTPRYDYGCDGLIHGLARGTQRRVLNNIICLTEGTPGATLPPPERDFQGDGNLFWSLAPDKPLDESLLAKFRKSPAFAASQAAYPAGWTTHDRVIDPGLTQLIASWQEPADLRLQRNSPAIDSGVSIPPDWPDPLRSRDRGQADIGALPIGEESWRVGVRGRIDVSGTATTSGAVPAIQRWAYPLHEDPPQTAPRRAAIVEGYPAFDSPIIAYLLRRKGWQVDIVERALLDSERYANYGLIVFDGSLVRAKADRAQLDTAELASLKSFLERGGTLLLMRERHAELFASPAGKAFLEQLTGTGTREPKPDLQLQAPDHPWLRHLPRGTDIPWLSRGASPLRTSRGNVLIGSPKGAAALYQLPVGQGQLIYVGWTIAQSLPSGRAQTTPEDEQPFDAQVALLQKLLPSAK